MRTRCLAVLFFLFVLAGCANTAYKTHSESSIFYAASQSTESSGTFKFNPICVVEAGRSSLDSLQPKFRGGDSCLYMAVEGSALLEHSSDINKDPERLDQLIDGLLLISDTNCSNFLHRVLAVTTNWETGDSIFSGITSVTSTALTKTKPDVSQIINLSGVISNDVTKELRKGFLLEGTFAALEKASNTLRAEIRAEIKNKRERRPPQQNMPWVVGVPFQPAVSDVTQQQPKRAAYSVIEILRDIRRYDDACSLRAASQKLLSIATDAELDARG